MENNSIVASIKKDYILSVLEAGKRVDGRSFDEYREIEIIRGYAQRAEGSALVKIGNTQVLAGVKLGLATPFPDTPDEGILSTTAELVPLASPTFDIGPPDEKAIELSRVVDRALRESHALDLEKLCIVPNEKVWLVNVDIYILDYDGNLFDASCLAAISALLDARFPKLEDDKVIYDEKTNEKLPIKNKPVEVTFAKIGKYTVVDPNLEEEEVMDARITFGITQENELCALQKGLGGSFKREEILELFDKAIEKAKELRRYLE